MKRKPKLKTNWKKKRENIENIRQGRVCKIWKNKAKNSSFTPTFYGGFWNKK
jgi:hypothetical protein